MFAGVEGVRDVAVNDHRISLSYEGKMHSLLEAVTAKYDVVDITTQEADLEEIFLTYYRDEAQDNPQVEDDAIHGASPRDLPDEQPDEASDEVTV